MTRALWWLWKPWLLVTRVIARWATQALRPGELESHLRSELEAVRQQNMQLEKAVEYAIRDREDLRTALEELRAQENTATPEPVLEGAVLR